MNLEKEIGYLKFDIGAFVPLVRSVGASLLRGKPRKPANGREREPDLLITHSNTLLE